MLGSGGPAIRGLRFTRVLSAAESATVLPHDRQWCGDGVHRAFSSPREVILSFFPLEAMPDRISIKYCLPPNHGVVNEICMVKCGCFGDNRNTRGWDWVEVSVVLSSCRSCRELEFCS